MSVIKLDKYLNSFFNLKLQDADKELYNSIRDEFIRQQNHIELIASENIVSKAVLEAQGSVLTNKYAEGYPSKRYYGGHLTHGAKPAQSGKLFNALHY